MDSGICNSQDKSNDVKLSTDTFSTHLNTDEQKESLITKSETVADTVNTFIKQETFIDKSLNIKQETFVDESLNIKQETFVDESLNIKQETFVDESLNTKQETFVDESLNIEQETKKEERFDENNISAEDVADVGYSNNYHSLLQKVMDEHKQHEFSNSLDIEHENGNMINFCDSSDLSESDYNYKNRNLQCMNSTSSGLKYQDTDTISESSIITQQKTSYKGSEENFGTSSFYGIDIQGSEEQFPCLRMLLDAPKKSTELCDKTLSLKTNLMHHDLISHQKLILKSIYQCQLCNRGFGDLNGIKSHVTVHLKSKDYICEKCDKRFAQKRDLNVHMKAVHLKIKDYICDKCDKRFSRISYLNLHVKTVHLKSKEYMCDECDLQFAQKSNLNGHMKAVHLNRKDYLCDKCNKRFAQKRDLNVHMKAVHLKIKDYICEKCDKQFSNKGDLTRHMRAVHHKRLFIPRILKRALSHQV